MVESTSSPPPPIDSADFERNDFDDIYTAYFEDLIATNGLRADPSGWARTEPGATFRCAAPMPPESLGHYVVDNRRLIAPEKNAVLALLSRWDERDYGYDELTLVPSISTASLAALLLLRSQGVTEILFETPAYYATVEQARTLGLRTGLIASHPDTEYRWDPTTSISRSDEPRALWLTQPRYSLGIDQCVNDLVDLQALMGKRDFLIIDETADQAWPSRLAAVPIGSSNPNLIKIRGLTKPLGLNALRLAGLLHAPCWRPALQEFQWLVGGALDRYSLVAAAQMATIPDLFETMLRASRARVAMLHLRLSALSGPRLQLTPMRNGYLGTVELCWERPEEPSRGRRTALLEFCRERRMAITLGSAMLFARHPLRERIRLNYFMPGPELEYSVEALREFAERKA
jgi:hypothetical protein